MWVVLWNHMKVSTGAEFFDNFLGGGYDEDIITTIYGPSGSGKTNLCLLAAVKVAESGKKVIFIDTEGGIAVERISQLSSSTVLDNMIFLNPMTFVQQKEIFNNLYTMINDSIGMIVVDSISMLYRLALGSSEEVYQVNSSLGKQLAQLIEIARSKKIPVLITNQVYADFENKGKVKMVGGDLLKYGSKCLIELHKFENCRGMTLRKHRSIAEGKEIAFTIINKGIQHYEVTKSL